jgi:hypothetical protein
MTVGDGSEEQGRFSAHEGRLLALLSHRPRVIIQINVAALRPPASGCASRVEIAALSARTRRTRTHNGLSALASGKCQFCMLTFIIYTRMRESAPKKTVFQQKVPSFWDKSLKSYNFSFLAYYGVLKKVLNNVATI